MNLSIHTVNKKCIRPDIWEIEILFHEPYVVFYHFHSPEERFWLGISFDRRININDQDEVILLESALKRSLIAEPEWGRVLIQNFNF